MTQSTHHLFTAGWTGDDQCGARCVCGATVDGFASLDEAKVVLDQHIADALNRADQIAAVEVELSRAIAEGADCTDLHARLAELRKQADQLCEDGWHASRTEPTDPCPSCGDTVDGTAAAPPVDPERAELIAGLREVVDFLESHPDVPVRAELGHCVLAADDESGGAEVARIAGLLGVAPTFDANGARVTRRFGPVAYEAFYNSRRAMRDWNALTSYTGAVQSDGGES